MQIRQPRNLVEYLILALLLTAIFLAIMYASNLMLADDPEPEAAITSTGPVVGSHPPDRYEQRFQQLEQWLGQTQDAYEARFEKLERHLVQATALNNDRVQEIGRQQAQIIKLPVERLRSIEERLARTTSRLNELTASLVTLANHTDTIVAANTALPITPPIALRDPPVASAPPVGPQRRAPQTVTSGSETNSAAHPEDPGPGARTARRQGKWAINLASYVNEKTAARNMGSFQKKGVAAEMVSATVNGRTIYRVRIAGFDTMAAAKAMAPTVKRQLDLEETWIMAN